MGAGFSLYVYQRPCDGVNAKSELQPFHPALLMHNLQHAHPYLCALVWLSWIWINSLACLQHQVNYAVWSSISISIPTKSRSNLQVKATLWAKGESHSMPWGTYLWNITSHASLYHHMWVNFKNMWTFPKNPCMHTRMESILTKPHLKVLHIHCWTMCMRLVVIWTHRWIAIHCANKCILMGIHI